MGKEQKRVFIARYGAFGDMIIITPVIRKFKSLGYYVIVCTTERGDIVLRNNPNIDKLIINKSDHVERDKLSGYLKKRAKKLNCDRYIDFTQTIETNLCYHPNNPQYAYTKKEKTVLADHNYYSHTMMHAGLLDYCETYKDYRGELFFTKKEEEDAQYILDSRKKTILWCLAGSGKNKAWPYYSYVWKALLESGEYQVISVGDEKCSILESCMDHPSLTKLSGRVSMRMSMALCKYVDLVISPDTGVLHAAGCFDTPKIGILGHTSIENITRYFENDHSIQSKASCSPCYRLIYHSDLQCPLDKESGSAWCMKELTQGYLMHKIEKVFNEKECVPSM